MLNYISYLLKIDTPSCTWIGQAVTGYQDAQQDFPLWFLPPQGSQFSPCSQRDCLRQSVPYSTQVYQLLSVDGIWRCSLGPCRTWLTPAVCQSHCHIQSGLASAVLNWKRLQQLATAAWAFFFGKRGKLPVAFIKTKIINALSLLLHLPRCQGFCLFCFVCCCYKISVSHSLFLTLQLFLIISFFTQTFHLEWFCIRGTKAIFTE